MIASPGSVAMSTLREADSDFGSALRLIDDDLMGEFLQSFVVTREEFSKYLAEW